MTISDTAWDVLWNVREADTSSAGCAEHLDPACLCDVDVSLTADIDWNRAPMDLLEVETTDELIEAAAAMLISADISGRLAEFRHEAVRPKNGTTERFDITDDTIARCLSHPRAVEFVACMVANPRIASLELARRFEGMHRSDIDVVRRALGLRAKVSAVARHTPRILAWAKAGWTPAEIANQLTSEGYDVKYNSIYTAVKRAGLIRIQAA